MPRHHSQTFWLLYQPHNWLPKLNLEMSQQTITNESPIVSIIIPTYNDWPVVCDAIDSALNQTYKNIEVIVIDDGSTDNTEKYLKDKYKDRIAYVCQVNKGPGSARNYGIRISSGKYLQFLDSDDLLDPDKIKIQVGKLQDVSNLALSICDYVYCDLSMSVTYDDWHVSPKLKSENPLEDIILKWETELVIPIHCFMFDSVLFKECGINFDESLSANEDWDCWMNIFALNPDIIYIDKVLAYYRVRKDSRCSNRMKMRKSHLRAINKQIKKNKYNREIVGKLNIRKTRTKFLYRDVGLLMRIFARCHPVVRRIYCENVPWRIQRILD
jgi:glycosyltransferase involved in cell wall biosynthesis